MCHSIFTSLHMTDYTTNLSSLQTCSHNIRVHLVAMSLGMVIRLCSAHRPHTIPTFVSKGDETNRLE